MIKNKKISSTLNDKIFAVETQCDNFFYSRNEFLANAVAQFQGQNLQKKKDCSRDRVFT